MSTRRRRPRTSVRLRYGIGPLRFSTPVTAEGCGGCVALFAVVAAVGIVALIVEGIASSVRANPGPFALAFGLLVLIGAVLAIGTFVSGPTSATNSVESTNQSPPPAHPPRFNPPPFVPAPSYPPRVNRPPSDTNQPPPPARPPRFNPPPSGPAPSGPPSTISKPPSMEAEFPMVDLEARFQAELRAARAMPEEVDRIQAERAIRKRMAARNVPRTHVRRAGERLQFDKETGKLLGWWEGETFHPIDR